MIDVETFAAAKAYTDSQGGGSGDGDMKKSVYDSDLAVAGAGGIGAFVSDAVSGKVDKVEGKGLSTNDYDNTEKGKVADNTSAIEAIVNEYGAKNLLPTVRSGSKNGAIFTVNADGSFTITGNPTAYTSFTLYNNLNLKTGQYILSGIPSGGGADKWGINCEVDGSWLPNSVWQGGATSYSINVSSIINQVTLIVYPKTDGDYNLTFYPMIRDARITDPTYVPYAMTNRELKERVTPTPISSFVGYGIVMKMIHINQWCLFVPLDNYICSKYNITATAAQIVGVANLTIDGVSINDNGVAVTVTDDLSSHINKCAIVTLSFALKS